MKPRFALLVMGAVAWAAGFALSDHVMHAVQQLTAQAASLDPALMIEECARMVKETNVPSEQASEAFEQCLEAK